MAEPAPAGHTERLRLDRWLFFSRLVKSRSLAAKLIETGHVRINGTKTQQAKRLVGPGDVLTIGLPGGVRIIRLVACGTRRGPAPEARTLYDDLTPPPPEPDGVPPIPRNAPSPGRRPDKHERERLQRLKRGGPD